MYKKKLFRDFFARKLYQIFCKKETGFKQVSWIYPLMPQLQLDFAETKLGLLGILLHYNQGMDFS